MRLNVKDYELDYRDYFGWDGTDEFFEIVEKMLTLGFLEKIRKDETNEDFDWEDFDKAFDDLDDDEGWEILKHYRPYYDADWEGVREEFSDNLVEAGDYIKDECINEFAGDDKEELDND